MRVKPVDHSGAKGAGGKGDAVGNGRASPPPTAGTPVRHTLAWGPAPPHSPALRAQHGVSVPSPLSRNASGRGKAGGSLARRALPSVYDTDDALRASRVGAPVRPRSQRHIRADYNVEDYVSPPRRRPVTGYMQRGAAAADSTASAASADGAVAGGGAGSDTPDALPTAATPEALAVAAAVACAAPPPAVNGKGTATAAFAMLAVRARLRRPRSNHEREMHIRALRTPLPDVPVEPLETLHGRDRAPISESDRFRFAAHSARAPVISDHPDTPEEGSSQSAPATARAAPALPPDFADGLLCAVPHLMAPRHPLAPPDMDAPSGPGVSQATRYDHPYVRMGLPPTFERPRNQRHGGGGGGGAAAASSYARQPTEEEQRQREAERRARERAAIARERERFVRKEANVLMALEAAGCRFPAYKEVLSRVGLEGNFESPMEDINELEIKEAEEEALARAQELEERGGARPGEVDGVSDTGDTVGGGSERGAPAKAAAPAVAAPASATAAAAAAKPAGAEGGDHADDDLGGDDGASAATPDKQPPDDGTDPHSPLAAARRAAALRHKGLERLEEAAQWLGTTLPDVAGKGVPGMKPSLHQQWLALERRTAERQRLREQLDEEEQRREKAAKRDWLRLLCIILTCGIALLCLRGRGSVLATLDADTRRAVACTPLNDTHLRALRRKYKDAKKLGALEDRVIDMDLLFTKFELSRVPMGDFLFHGDDLPPQGRAVLTFGAFVRVTLRFCMLSRSEVAEMVFNGFATGGLLDEKQFGKLYRVVSEGKPVFGARPHVVFREFDKDRDGLLTLDDFVAVCAAHPLLMVPVQQLQQQLQNATLGEKQWQFLQREARGRLLTRAKELMKRQQPKRFARLFLSEAAEEAARQKQAAARRRAARWRKRMRGCRRCLRICGIGRGQRDDSYGVADVDVSSVTQGSFIVDLEAGERADSQAESARERSRRLLRGYLRVYLAYGRVPIPVPKPLYRYLDRRRKSKLPPPDPMIEQPDEEEGEEEAGMEEAKDAAAAAGTSGAAGERDDGELGDGASAGQVAAMRTMQRQWLRVKTWDVTPEVRSMQAEAVGMQLRLMKQEFKRQRDVMGARRQAWKAKQRKRQELRKKKMEKMKELRELRKQGSYAALQAVQEMELQMLEEEEEDEDDDDDDDGTAMPMDSEEEA